MKRLSFCVALWLIPIGAAAQSLPADRDEEVPFVAPLSVIGSGDHPPSTTETSPAKARVARRAGKTIMLTNGSRAPEQVESRMANAGG